MTMTMTMIAEADRVVRADKMTMTTMTAAGGGREVDDAPRTMTTRTRAADTGSPTDDDERSVGGSRGMRFRHRSVPRAMPGAQKSQPFRLKTLGKEGPRCRPGQFH